MQEMMRIKKRIQAMLNHLRSVFLCISKIPYDQIWKEMILYSMLL